MLAATNTDSASWLLLVKIASLSAEKADLTARLDEIYDTYSGCDWCCGGGDEAVAWISERLREIDALLLGVAS